MNNFSYGFSNPYNVGMMGAQIPQYGMGPYVGSASNVAAYTGRKKDDTAVKVGALGTLAVAIAALIIKKRGVVEALKGSKVFTETSKAATSAIETATNTAKKAKKVVKKASKVAPKKVQTVVADTTTKATSNVASKTTEAGEKTQGFFSKLFSKIKENREFNKVVRDSAEYSKNNVHGNNSSALRPIEKATVAKVPATTTTSTPTFYDKPKVKGKIKEHHQWQYTAEQARLDKQVGTPTFYDKPKVKGKIKEHHQWQYTAEQARLDKKAAAPTFYDRPHAKGKIKEHHEWQYTAEKTRLEKAARSESKITEPLHKKSISEEKQAIRKNNAEANKARAIGNQIQNTATFTKLK